MRLTPGNDLNLGHLAGSNASLVFPRTSRDKHLYVCGGTGTGKSKFLESLIRQDIIANRKSKCGMLVLDPHGNLYDSLVRWLAKRGFDRPIVPIDLRQDDWVVSYNLLRQRKKADPAVLVSNLIDAMAYVWGETGTDQTPRFARWAGNVIRALYEKKLTLIEAAHLVEIEASPLYNGGMYRYYRCTRKGRDCSEPYIQEKDVTSQCLEIIRPFVACPSTTAFLRDLIDQDAAKNSDLVMGAASEVNERLTKVQNKLNKLTRAYLDEVLDEESYQAAKADLVLEKATLKAEKTRLQKTGASYWIEPAKEVINALELATKTETTKCPDDIALLVQKIGTNRLISQKKVTIGFSEPYAFASEFLTSMSLGIADNELNFSRSSKWWTLQDSNL